MPGWGWILIVVAAVVLIAIIAWVAARSRRSKQLQEGFGPEYERTVERSGDRRAAESELEARRERREELDIRALQPAARERYVSAWHQTQARFVDAPADALTEADSLVTSVMAERGYPMEDFDQRAADVSVDHPTVVENYRAAHAISTASGRGQASTEDMRQAMVHYRALFEELVDGGTDGGTGAVERSEVR